MDFGQRLRSLRDDAGITQRDLAARAGLDFTYLSKMETGDAPSPSETAIKRLAGELSAILDLDQQALADELTLIAGKVPSDIAEVILRHPEAVRYLRSLD